MILIATDEAGYGPKLGPLVVAASAWRVPGDFEDVAELKSRFAKLAEPVVVDGQRIVVDDSKAVFKPQSARKTAAAGADSVAPHAKLERVTLAGCRWCGLAGDRLAIVNDLAATDESAIRAVPWLNAFSTESIGTDRGQPLVDRWSSGAATLLWVQARVITAESFNRSCDAGMNKSDLLSHTTLELVRAMLERLSGSQDESVHVFCDRHGGRRYYAGPLQSAFDGTLVQVIAESKTESRYRVPYRDGDFTVRFTVKGDSFTPVAFSSMVAKYLREKAMDSMNAYFADLHCATGPLRRTAGYPVDADRFLSEIAPIVRREKIAVAKLVRSR